MMKLIVNLAPTGMIPTKEITEYVPISPSEIVKDVLNCYNKGITTVHLHARDDDGQPTYRKEIYAEIISGIRKQAPDLVIVVSCSGRNDNTFNKRSDVLDLSGKLKPDMASLTLGSLNFSKTASINSPKMITMLAEKMLRKGIKPELEIFDAGMLNYAHYLIKKEILQPPYYFNILLGNIFSAQMELTQLGMIINGLPEDSYWSLAGFGANQITANMLAVASGGGVRTGIEDNIWLDQSSHKKATNYALVELAQNIGKSCGRTVMSSAEFRDIFKIPIK